MQTSDSAVHREENAASSCAACKLLRRRCSHKCVFSPYFPSNDLQRFADAHRVFGASNIKKMLQDLETEKREDAVTSMVYEANARLKDPVYGCTGIICQLKQQYSQLQSQLATAQEELLQMHSKYADLLAVIGGVSDEYRGEFVPFSPTSNCFLDQTIHNPPVASYDEDPEELWQSLWE
eukprot:Gb_08465 [translate_table: standard]